MDDRLKAHWIRTVWRLTDLLGRCRGRQAASRGLAAAGSDAIAAAEILAMIRRCPQPVCRVADIGCGSGRIARSLMRQGGLDQVVAVDYLPRRAGPAVRGLDYVVADGRRLPFRPQSFDFIYCYSLLHYLPLADVERLLTRLKAALRPQGRLLLAEVISRRGYFNAHLRRQPMPAFTKALWRVYLNLAYPYYFHPRADLEAVYRRLGMAFDYFAQDGRMPYARHVHHVLLHSSNR